MLEQLTEENRRLRLAVAMVKAQDQTRIVEGMAKNVRKLKSEYEESLRALGVAQATWVRLSAELADVEMEFSIQNS